MKRQEIKRRILNWLKGERYYGLDHYEPVKNGKVVDLTKVDFLSVLNDPEIEWMEKPLDSNYYELEDRIKDDRLPKSTPKKVKKEKKHLHLYVKCAGMPDYWLVGKYSKRSSLDTAIQKWRGYDIRVINKNMQQDDKL